MLNSKLKTTQLRKSVLEWPHELLKMVKYFLLFSLLKYIGQHLSFFSFYYILHFLLVRCCNRMGYYEPMHILNPNVCAANGLLCMRKFYLTQALPFTGIYGYSFPPIMFVYSQIGCLPTYVETPVYIRQ